MSSDQGPQCGVPREAATESWSTGGEQNCVQLVSLRRAATAEGLLDGSLGFCGEESAGASVQRTDGTTWTTDKDGIVLSLLAAEITATLGIDPGARFAEIRQEYGATVYERIDAHATAGQRRVLAEVTSADLDVTCLAGEAVRTVATTAPGNGAAIGGVKVSADHGLRPRPW